MRIGVDLMGGDQPPQKLFPAVQRVAARFAHASFCIFAPQEWIDQRNLPVEEGSPLYAFPCEEVIRMKDAPLEAVRRKRNSSMLQGVEALKEGRIDAFVSLGNTGALFAASKMAIKPFVEELRPALLALLPTLKSPVVVVDVGANVSCKPQHLLQFALMGVAYQRCVHGKNQVRVGLLNIGAEDSKGTKQRRQAFAMLKEFFSQESGAANFVGNVEGKEIFQGEVDVLVTDGFSGNIFLKASEGASEFILRSAHTLFSNLPEAQEKIAQLKESVLCTEEFSGALLCGLQRLVIKCHGSADDHVLEQSIARAVRWGEYRFLQKVQDFLLESGALARAS